MVQAKHLSACLDPFLSLTTHTQSASKSSWLHLQTTHRMRRLLDSLLSPRRPQADGSLCGPPGLLTQPPATFCTSLLAHLLSFSTQPLAILFKPESDPIILCRNPALRSARNNAEVLRKTSEAPQSLSPGILVSSPFLFPLFTPLPAYSHLALAPSAHSVFLFPGYLLVWFTHFLKIFFLKSPLLSRR